MWQTKGCITIVLVLVVVGLILVNTVQLKPDARLEPEQRPGQTQARHHRPIGDGPPAPPAARTRASDADRRGANERGQLETFSAESTGLGDLEGADSLKKMLRRYGGPVRPEAAARQPLAARTRRAGLTQQPGAPLETLKQLLIERRRRLNQPILVVRRTGEQLLDDDGANSYGQQQQHAPDDQSEARISLLTMRKVLEPEELVSRVAGLPFRADNDQTYLGYAARDGAGAPAARIQTDDNMASSRGYRSGASALDGQGASILVHVDRNYLPRIARALSHNNN